MHLPTSNNNVPLATGALGDKEVIKNIIGALLLLVLLAWVSTLSTVQASPIDDIQFEGQVLEKVTPLWLAKVKVLHADKISYLRKLATDNGLPEGTLATMAVVESMMGELNIKNKAGYEGWFQFGGYEQRMVGLNDPYNLYEAAPATIRLLRDYHRKAPAYGPAVRWEQRGMVDWYFLHQQGYRGTGEHLKSIVNDTPLPRKIVVNTCHNVAKQYVPVLFGKGCKLNPGITDHDLSLFLYRQWEYEMNRIWNAIK